MVYGIDEVADAGEGSQGHEGGDGGGRKERARTLWAVGAGTRPLVYDRQGLDSRDVPSGPAAAQHVIALHAKARASHDLRPAAARSASIRRECMAVRWRDRPRHQQGICV